MFWNDYFDWSEVSGIYLPKISRIDRYRAYQRLISEAGWVVVIVAGFLEDVPGEPDPVKWRSWIAEVLDEADQRVQLTAQALDTIGAVRTAAAVKTIKPTSPFALLEQIGPATVANLDKAQEMINEQARVITSQCESRAEIQTLLERYAAAHTPELNADITRYGDPRQKSGYDRESRVAELKELQLREWQIRNQLKNAEELNEATRTLNEKISKAGVDPKALKRLTNDRKSFRELLSRLKEIASEKRGPELNAALQVGDQLVKAHEVFFNPPPTKDAALNDSLAELGKFTGDTDSDPCDLEWESPAGFSGPWGDFSLVFYYPPGKNKALSKLVTAAKRLAPKLPELSLRWYRELIQNFRQTYVDQLDEDELAIFEVDASGVITDDSIRKHAGKGSICLQHEDGDFFGHASFPIAWDEEHGCEIELEGDLMDELLSKS